MNKRLFILVITLICFSCGTDMDDKLTVSPPSDFHYLGGLPIPFYTHGDSDLPSINWGNEVGLFSLNALYTGISVNSSTGIISWNENLPLGENTIQVNATNSVGTAIATVLAYHQFGGHFNGGYNMDPNSTVVSLANLNITFNVDGTMSITDSGNTVMGTWSFVAEKLICHYTLASVNYELVFDLTYSVTVNPLLEGFKRIEGNTSNIGFARLNYI